MAERVQLGVCASSDIQGKKWKDLWTQDSCEG